MGLKYVRGKYSPGMLKFAHRCLLKMDPETSHNIAMRGLKLARLAVKLPSTFPTPSIQFSRLPKLRFPSRVGLAAGFDKNAEAFSVLFRFGFGFIEVGTVTPLPQVGNPKPRIWRVSPEALVNRLGFNNVGLKQFVENIKRWRPAAAGFPLFANIGKGIHTPVDGAIEDYVKCAQALDSWVDALVVNVSSPNTKGLRQLQNENFLEELSRKMGGTLPVFVKLAPDLENSAIQQLANQVNENSRFSGMVLTNTSIRLAKEIAERNQGGLSGRPLFDRALECVALAREQIKEPKLVIGVGGISSVEQARQMRTEGADLIEVYSSFIYQGTSWIKLLSEKIA